MPVWIIISYLFFSAFEIFTIVKLFKNGEKQYAKFATSTYVVYSLIFFVIWIFKMNVPAYILLLTMLTAFFSCFIGYFLKGYTRSKTFDRYLHAFGVFSFSLLVFCMLDDFVEAGGSKIFQSLFIFTIGNTLGSIFELIEASHDAKNVGTVRCQKGLKDTNMDMLFNVIGSVLCAVFAYFWLL